MRAHLAICGHGFLGLITSDAPQATPYSADYQDVAWIGIHLTEARGKKIGDRWQSKKPRILCHLSSWAAFQIIRRFQEEPRWASYPADQMKVNNVVRHGPKLVVYTVECDMYELTESGWSQVAGTAAANDPYNHGGRYPDGSPANPNMPLNVDYDND